MRSQTVSKMRLGTLSRVEHEKSFLRDAFDQLEEVLKRRAAGAAGASGSGEAAAGVHERQRQVREADQMIQRWLAVFARQHLADICTRLMKAAKEHDVPVAQQAEARLPHSGDAPEDPSISRRTRDESTTFFLLETLRRVLCAAVDTGGGSSGSANLPLRNVPEGLLSFCFERLSLEHPTAIRHVAAHCVGVLSRAHLKATVDKFLDKVRAPARVLSPHAPLEPRSLAVLCVPLHACARA